MYITTILIVISSVINIIKKVFNYSLYTIRDTFNLLILISVMVIFIWLIVYKYCFELNNGLFVSFLSFLLSGLIFSYVLNKFTYSENILVKFLQKVSVYVLIIFISITIGSYLNFINIIDCSSIDPELNSEDINNKSNNNIISINRTTNLENKEEYKISISKDLVDNTLKIGGEFFKAAAEFISPNFGAGTAAGAAASAAIKSTSGLPPVQRAAIIGSSTLITAVTSKVGLDIGTQVSKKMDILEAIKKSKFADSDKLPNPDDSFINNPLEIGDSSPLESLLFDMFILNVLLLILFIIFIVIIFNRYMLQFNSRFISSLVDKFMPDKIKLWFNKSLNLGIDYNSRIMFIIFLVNSITLLLILLLNIYVSAEVYNNISDYITIYNYLHSNKS